MIIKLAQATASKAPKARHIPAWGEAPWMIAQMESEGRRPDLYPPVTHERASAAFYWTGQSKLDNHHPLFCIPLLTH